MKRPWLRLAALLVALLGLAARARAEKLAVLTTIPDLADVVREVGGERVEVTSIARGTENLHQVQARPSHLIAASRADLFVQVGLSLESSFVPALLEGARNARIRPGAKGFVNASQGWQAIGVPETVSRRAGDVHPQGNPHLNLDPRAGRVIADAVLAGLVRVDPGSAELYQRRHGEYVARLDEARARWEELARGWKGRKVVLYHLEYEYLAARYGLEVVGSIEPKPGIPPTPNHVAELTAKLRKEGPATILTAPWSNDGHVARIAEETGAGVVVLPNQCGGTKETSTWIGMMDEVHRRLARAFGGAPGGG